MVNWRVTLGFPLLVAWLMQRHAKEVHYQDDGMKSLLKMKTKMKALVTDKQGSVKLETVERPNPGPGQVLVKMMFAPVNPSDIYNALGEYSVASKEVTYPHLNGFEGVGEVVMSGGGVWPLAMTKNKLRVAVVTPGATWSEYAVVDADKALPVPESISDHVAAAAFVNPLTVVGFLELAKENGHKAIVHTAANSALGKMLIKAAKKYDVKIICVVRGEHNEKNLVDELGHPKDLVVRSDGPNFEKELKRVVESAGATLAFDAVAGDMSQKVFDAMPEKSENFVYGRLSGQNPPEALMNIGKDAAKSFSFFLVKDWLDEGGVFRLLKSIYSLYMMLENELSTEFEHVHAFNDPKTIDVLHSYFKHQKGGKILLDMTSSSKKFDDRST